MEAIEEFVGQTRVGEPVSFRNLTVFPLIYAGDKGPDYAILNEAMSLGEAEVSELEEGESVPTLVVRNKGDRSVLILAGQGLEGGLQNRTVNTSILADIGETRIPVSCVEQGRWERSSDFCSRDFAHSSLRSLMLVHTSHSLRTTRTFHSEQSEVWDEISRLSDSTNSPSETGSLYESFSKFEETVKEYEKPLERLGSCHGVLVGVNGRIVGMDMLSREDPFEKVRSRLLRSYIVEAMEKTNGTKTCPADAAQSFLEGLGRAKTTPFPSCSLGTDMRWETNDLQASALVHQDHVVHLMAFRRKRFSPFD